MENQIYHPFEQVCEHKETIEIDNGFILCIEENGCGKAYRIDDQEARVYLGRCYNAVEDEWLDNWMNLSEYEEKVNDKAHNL